MSIVRIVGGALFPVAVVLDAIGDEITSAGVLVIDDGGPPGFPSLPGGGSLSAPFTRAVGGGLYPMMVVDNGDDLDRMLSAGVLMVETGFSEAAPDFVPRVIYY